MIVDTSAIVAILRNEPTGSRCADILAEAEVVRISAATYLEASILVDGSRSPVLSQDFNDLIEATEMTIEPVTERHAHLAREAYRMFGRGSGHPAQLNFGQGGQRFEPLCWERFRSHGREGSDRLAERRTMSAAGIRPQFRSWFREDGAPQARRDRARREPGCRCRCSIDGEGAGAKGRAFG